MYSLKKYSQLVTLVSLRLLVKKKGYDSNTKGKSIEDDDVDVDGMRGSQDQMQG